MIELSSDNFEQFIKNAKVPVLVDFWAPWCSPCKAISPSLEKLSKEFEGRAIVAKLNIDEAQDLATQQGIMSIPALIIFSGGVSVKKTVGAQSYEKLQEFMNSGL